MLPCSDGRIEILGRDIAEYNDPTLLSICPQFYTHLCDELTPYEHFVMYSMLFRLNPQDAASETDRLINALDLEELKDKPIRELSGGDVRKLTIALSFLGPAKIILLDEPTASLDAVARHHVHEMITSFKGEKTFMLCTHLLSEAETLCDNISIMIKGCVYTVGSPGYLSDKFGTEFKVDLMLDDEGEDSARACDKFFSQRLPTAVLSIARPKTRLYNVPAAGIALPQLFTIMEEGRQSSSGGNYYTCSSSSLERVFMEIVRLSESQDGGGGEDAE
jgi:ABC-type multidrug transport system ATPase subunit